jgi:DNA (cytosine-5)-methyltransferase 1
MDKKNKNQIRIASLFAGVGGFERGFDFANIPYDNTFVSEIDLPAQKTYLSNYKPNVLTGDITKINERDVPDHDFLVGGFPCQAFSIAGSRKGFEDTRGTLFFDVVRILNEKRPKYFLLENVKNLVGHDGSRTIRIMLDKLGQLGYVIDFSVINAQEAGAPQNRERTYIAGVLGGKRQKYNKDSRNKKVDNLKNTLNKDSYPSFNLFKNLKFNNKQLYLKDVIQKEVPESYYFETENIINFLTKLNIGEQQKSQPKIIKLFDLPRDVHNDLERQRRVYSINGISPTALARSDTTKILIEVGNKKRIRKLTPYENFKIQGYDTKFVNNIIKNSGNSNTQLYKQSGNAVSPLVVSELIRSMLKYGQIKR